ncbi:P-loop containing nucleoside triphosphate hydrolase protein [Mycena metata]|uniref:DNA 3'-5' helicase n=1 Tax=Mycena metata TaxID=1033252 RepID=A0AAD7N9Y5_9AGAR|nr:P-loop containing nucleoside triphosphate hydrolase protein [Mycena metata]
MVPNPRWQDPIGRQTIQTIVKKLIPNWTTGLRPIQEDLVSPILDSEDVLCCTATGDGKSAAFSIPILVLNEYNANRQLYPSGLRTRQNPVGLVVTPTKGLASNIVSELKQLGVSAFSYCRESLAESRRNGIDLTSEIKTCQKYQVICVDPEHLRSKEWREISDSSIFRAHIFYAATDEVHLINTWGLEFRTDFGLIGLFVRGRLPSSISVVGLSATLAPGRATTAVCETLGLYGNAFHLIRRTNERPNVQFIMKVLGHGISGYSFPDLLPFLQSGRKAVIFCPTIDMVFRVYVFIWRLQSRTADKLRRTRMYTSLCPAEYNQETLRLLNDDPYFQIVIATVAFSNGINATTLDDSITLSFPVTGDNAWQNGGRVGRKPGSIGRSVMLVQPSSIAAASKQIANPPSESSTGKKRTKGGRQRGAVASMDPLKARLLTEITCLNAVVNDHYANPPLDTSTVDCIAANRPLPCSLCLPQSGKTLIFAVPPDSPRFEPLALPAAPAPSTFPLPPPKKNKLTKKERKPAAAALIAYRDTLCEEQHLIGNFIEHPISLFLPSTFQTALLDKLITLESRTAFDIVIKDWRHRGLHGTTLFNLVSKLRSDVHDERGTTRLARNAAQRQKRKDGQPRRSGTKRKAPSSEESEEEQSDSSESDSDSSMPAAVLTPPPTVTRKPRKRPALGTVTNAPKTKSVKAPAPSAAEVAKEYRPAYNFTI